MAGARRHPAQEPPANQNPSENPGGNPGGNPGREPGLGRSSRVMAVGTIASRSTGFLRNAVIAAGVGTQLIGNAYTVANTVPNILYELLLGGVLTSVVVPLLVQAARSDGDGGQAYANRLLTLIALVLGGISVLAVLAAPLIIALFTLGGDPDQRDLATTFARLLLPQIAFYAVGATIGAILQTRHRFGPPMWAPVLNNLVVIVTGVLFLLAAGEGSLTLANLTSTQVYILGVGTTLGVVVQTVALIPFLRASGFHYRPRLDIRGSGLVSQGGPLAGWMLCYVVVNQIGLLVVINLAASAAEAAGAGYAAYFFAFLVFQLPHAVVAVSVVTALLPRMSRAALEDDLARVRRDLGRGMRLTSVVLVPAALAFLVLGPVVTTVIYAHQNVSVEQAHFVGQVLAGFAVGLVPFSLFQLQLRGFYALRDTKTPALINVGVNGVNIVVDLLLYVTLPPGQRIIGLAIGYGLSYVAGLALSTAILRRRLGGVEGHRVLRTLVRLAIAATIGAVVAALLAEVASRGFGAGPYASIPVLGVAVLGGGIVYMAAAARMRVAEVREFVQMMLSGSSHPRGRPTP